MEVELTLGSETSQYQEEKRTKVYSLSSGERNGRSTNSATKSIDNSLSRDFGDGGIDYGVRLKRIKSKNAELEEAAGKLHSKG